MTDSHVETLCDGCGQLDNHPMIHVGPYVWQKDDRTSVADPSFHFDCLPAEIGAMLGRGPEHAVTLAAIDAAVSGVHGDDLREFILEQPSDNEVEVDPHLPDDNDYQTEGA